MPLVLILGGFILVQTLVWARERQSMQWYAFSSAVGSVASAVFMLVKIIRELRSGDHDVVD